MSKILNLSNNIKINKNNLQDKFTFITKSTGSGSNPTFTLTQRVANSCVLILVDYNCKCKAGMVIVHDNTTLRGTASIYGDLGLSVSGNTLTVTACAWSTVTLIDFNSNIWS